MLRFRWLKSKGEVEDGGVEEISRNLVESTMFFFGFLSSILPSLEP